MARGKLAASSQAPRRNLAFAWSGFPSRSLPSGRDVRKDGGDDIATPRSSFDRRLSRIIPQLFVNFNYECRRHRSSTAGPRRLYLLPHIERRECFVPVPSNAKHTPAPAGSRAGCRPKDTTMPHQTSPAQAAPSSRRARRSARLHPRHLPWVFAFFMAAIMAMIMCTVIVGANTVWMPGCRGAFWAPMRSPCRSPSSRCWRCAPLSCASSPSSFTRTRDGQTRRRRASPSVRAAVWSSGHRRGRGCRCGREGSERRRLTPPASRRCPRDR